MTHKPYGPYEKYLKRPQDFLCALLATIVLSPIMLITAILVAVKLGRPVLFTLERPGRNEKIFKIYKFRTMTDGRDERGNLLPDEVRLTSFGKKLRSTSLDELPELFNILKLPSATKIESFSSRRFEMIELKLKPGSPLEGVRLSDLRNKYTQRFLVCAVQRGEEVFIPDGSFVLQSGDRIGLTAAANEVQRLLKMLALDTIMKLFY